MRIVHNSSTHNRVYSSAVDEKKQAIFFNNLDPLSVVVWSIRGGGVDVVDECRRGPRYTSTSTNLLLVVKINHHDVLPLMGAVSRWV